MDRKVANRQLLLRVAGSIILMLSIVMTLRVASGQAIQLDLNPSQVAFDYSGLARSVHGVVVPAKPQDPQAPMLGAEPEHLRYTFDNDKNPDYFDPKQRQLLIYPVAAYRAITTSMVNGVNIVDQRIDQLNEMIEKQSTNVTGTEGTIPLLPIVNAEQVLTAAVKYLSFPGGAGFRYIAYYAQDVSPITRGSIFYTFQGLTHDGKYYVSIFYPVMTSVLPENVDLPAKDYDTFAANWKNYLGETRQKLNTAEYTPALARLDALIESLRFHLPAPTRSPTSSPTATPVPTYNLWADSRTINRGQCTYIHWATNNVKDVYFGNGSGEQGVVGNDTLNVCPATTTTYSLRVLLNNGQQFQQTITINVIQPQQPTVTPVPLPTATQRPPVGTMVLFSTDKGEDKVTLSSGQCVTLTWRAAGNFAQKDPFVLNVGGASSAVPYTGSQQVCPKQSEVATFTVTFANGATTSRKVTILVK